MAETNVIDLIELDGSSPANQDSGDEDVEQLGADNNALSAPFTLNQIAANDLHNNQENHINDSMNEEFIAPRFKIARELTQEDEKQLGAVWATTSSVVGAGV